MTTPINIAEGAAQATWPTEERDIADVIAMVRQPLCSGDNAAVVIRSLLGLAKTAAYAAGAQYGLRLGEQVANRVIRETRAALAGRNGE